MYYIIQQVKSILLETDVGMIVCVCGGGGGGGRLVAVCLVCFCDVFILFLDGGFFGGVFLFCFMICVCFDRV